MALAAELVFEHEMTKEKLLEMVKIVENAEKFAVRGQVLHLKVNHNTQFVFRSIYKEHVSTSISRETEQVPEQ